MKLLAKSLLGSKFLASIVLFFIFTSSILIFAQSLAIANVINIGFSLSDKNVNQPILKEDELKKKQGRIQKIKNFISLFSKDKKSASKYLIAQDDFLLLLIIGICFIAAMFIVQLFHFLRSFFTDYLAVKMVANIRKILFNHIIRLPFSFYQKNNNNTLASKIINDTYYLQTYLYDFIEAVILGPIVAMLALVLLLKINISFSIIILISFFVFSFLINFIFRKLKSIINNMQKKIGNLSDIILQAFKNIDIVKIYGGEKKEQNKFSKKIKEFIQDVKKERIFFRLSTPLMEFFGIILLFVIFIYGSILVWQQKMTVDNILEFLIIFLFIAPYVQRIGKIFALRQQIYSIVDGVNQILSIPKEILETSSSKNQKEFSFEKSLEFKNVFYKYPLNENKKSDYQIDNISLKIHPKEFIAIVGESGSGKTTLLQILTTLLNASKGDILYDGLSSQKINKKEMRKNIAYIGQSPKIFNDSIKNNICYQKDYSLEEIKNSCQLADIEKFIRLKKQQYELVIGEGETQLSGGQLQRLCIARAIVKQAKIIIMDEPTSSLDNFSEEKINKTIDYLKQNSTIILSTHRLNSIQKADRIFFLNKGKISAQGTHKELLKKSKDYKNLYQKNFKL